MRATTAETRRRRAGTAMTPLEQAVCRAETRKNPASSEPHRVRSRTSRGGARGYSEEKKPQITRGASSQMACWSPGTSQSTTGFLPHPDVSWQRLLRLEVVVG